MMCRFKHVHRSSPIALWLTRLLLAMWAWRLDWVTGLNAWSALSAMGAIAAVTLIARFSDRLEADECGTVGYCVD